MAKSLEKVVGKCSTNVSEGAYTSAATSRPSTASLPSFKGGSYSKRMGYGTGGNKGGSK